MALFFILRLLVAAFQSFWSAICVISLFHLMQMTLCFDWDCGVIWCWYHAICLKSWRFLNEYSPWFAVYLYNILILNALLITSITRVFAANAFLFSNEAVPERVFVKKISSRSWGGNGAVDTWCFQSCNAEEKQYVSEVYHQPVGQLQ